MTVSQSSRIRGNSIILKLAGTDYSFDASSIVLENEEATANVTTFADAANGGAYQYFFTISGVQSYDSTSLWKKLWDIAGNTTAIAYVFNPWGVATPTTTKPNFTGTVLLKQKPKIGGDAGMDSYYTFDIRLDCQETPTVVTA